jgi:hypothetical protein
VSQSKRSDASVPVPSVFWEYDPFPRHERLTGARQGDYIRELSPMTDSRSLRRWLAIAGMLAAGCNSSSPLVWSAADDLDNDDDGDERVTEEPVRPPPPPPPKDAGMVDEDPMDSGVIVAEPPPKRPPCGTGPGCDPTDLGGETCVSLGMQAGTLRCDEETCMYDTSLCGPGGGLGGAGGLFGGGSGAGNNGEGGSGAGSFFGGNFFGGGQDDDGGTAFFGGE